MPTHVAHGQKTLRTWLPRTNIRENSRGGHIFNSRVNQQSRLIPSFDLFYVPIKIAPKCSPGIRLSTVFPRNLTFRNPAALKVATFLPTCHNTALKILLHVR